MSVFIFMIDSLTKFKKSMKKRNINALLSRYSLICFCILVSIILFIISKGYGMFWDNVLFVSKMGNQLFENNIFNWTIPDSFDPGHPPFLAFLLAISWKIFGHSLLVSHLVMLPFVIGIIYQLHLFTYYYTKDVRISYLGFFLIIADPTLLTSLVLVNPETIIIFFFFLALNGILYKKKKWKFIGFLFLSIITFRSMMLFAGLFLFDILNQHLIEKKKIKKIVNIHFFSFYFLSAIPGFIFISWRLLTKGWLQTHQESPWGSLWHLPSLKQFFKNIVVLIWRYIDFGRIFIYLFIIVSLLVVGKKITKFKSIQQLIILASSSVVFIIITVLFSTNAFGHRYFIVSYVSFILVAFLIITKLKKYKKIIYSFLLVGLLTGNLWIYPEKISQGWDATLAHTPYHNLRIDAIKYLDSNKIKIAKVASFFPNYNTIDEIDFSGDQRSFSKFNFKNDFVFYSNVYNLSDEEFDALTNNYIQIKRFEKANIYVSIYKIKIK